MLETELPVSRVILKQEFDMGLVKYKLTKLRSWHKTVVALESKYK